MKNLLRHPAYVMAVNFLIAMALYMAARWFFYFMNMSSFQDVAASDLFVMCVGGLRFDVSALCYLNILFVVLQTIPAKFRDRSVYQKVIKYLFCIINSVGLVVNAADVVYFNFGGRRTTATIFSEFGNEDNLGKILAESVTDYWPVWLFGIASVAALWLLYYNPIKVDRKPHDYAANIFYYPFNSLLFVLMTLLAFVGLRGGWAFKMHPLRLDSAELYIKKPSQAAIVLNTPFTMLTTLHKSGFKNPQYYDSELLDSQFNPLHNSSVADGPMKKTNIMMLILEGFSSEYYGYFNHDLDDGEFKGYTPFLDSLIAQSYSFEYSFANGIRSVDAMPGIFAGIPRYIEPYCYYVYANNTIQGLPEMLSAEGYRCVFFHGAPNTTLGFKMFTNSIGFSEYYGMDEFEDKSEFDGTWAIWDEPYLQYFAKESDKIAKTGQPFLITVFTASSHHPFKIPEKYDDGRFPEGTHPMHKAVRYADYSLRRFFDAIKDCDWAKNTIFVITADHTGPNAREEYANEMGRFQIPIFFYTPGGQLPVKCDSTRIMQQIDLTPTLLGLLDYKKPFFSFGKDVFSQDSSFVNYVFNDLNGSSMYYQDSLMLEYKNGKPYGLFDYRHDKMLKNNLLDRSSEFSQFPQMEQQIQTIIQQYIERMKNNELIAK